MVKITNYENGSRSFVFETGDRIILNKRCKEDWLRNHGDIGTVLGLENPKERPSLVSRLKVRTDRMVNGGWGGISPVCLGN